MFQNKNIVAYVSEKNKYMSKSNETTSFFKIKININAQKSKLLTFAILFTKIYQTKLLYKADDNEF